MSRVVNEKEWIEAVRLLNKFFPQSRPIIFEPRHFGVNEVYELASCSGLKVQIESFGLSHGCEYLLKYYASSESLGSEGRVLAIHDLLAFETVPIICSSKTILKRVSEGVGEYAFIAGGDTLFAFESTGQVILFDHDDRVTVIDQQ